MWQEREDSPDFHIFTREEVEKANWSEETRNLFYNFSYQVYINQSIPRSIIHLGTQVGEDKLSGPITMEEVEKDYAHFQNHCCDPNTWFAEGDADAIIARRDIQPGEEITYDYATSETEARFGFEKCCCNAGLLCRGKVTSCDWQLPELQERYGRHFAPFIVELILQQRSKKE